RDLRRPAGPEAPVAALPRRLRTGVAGGVRRLRAPPALAVGHRQGYVARRRARTVWHAIPLRDSAALDPYHRGGGAGDQSTGRHLLSTAHRLLRETRLGAQRGRVSDARSAQRLAGTGHIT